MAYTDTEVERILALKDVLEENKNKFMTPTYHDSPALTELIQIVEKHTDMTDEDELGDSRAIYSFIAECYYEMGRYGVAAGFFTKAVEYAAAMSAEAFEDEDLRSLLESDIYTAAKLRNSYADVKDSCRDIVKLAAKLIGKERAESVVKDGIDNVNILHDAVENTPEYLAVIDGIEKQIDDKLGTDMYMGKCHAIWSMKRELLEAEGIEWRSPSSINRGIMFD